MTNLDKRSLVGQLINHSVDKMPISYRVMELQASNSVLDTYMATHEAVKLKIALKVLTPSLTAQPGFSSRFQDTIKTLLKFNSPYLLKLYDYGNDNEVFYLVAEYHKSPSLRRTLDDDKRIPLATAVEYAQLLSEALSYAAQSNIFHGIISPQSVTISSKRGPLLGDIGIAPLIGLRLPKALNDDLSLAYYTAPEVARGHAINSLSDQYSLTAMLYEMVTGQPPFNGSTGRAVADQHATAAVPDPAAIDPSLAALSGLIARGMAKSPTQRYPSFMEYIAALGDVLRAPPIAAPRSAEPKPQATPAPISAPVSAPDLMAMDHTMPEGISIQELKSSAPSNGTPSSESEPAGMDRTMPEGLFVEELHRAAQELPPTYVPSQATAQPAAKAPEPMAMDRTMPEGFSINEARPAVEQPPPPNTPAPPQPAPIPSAPEPMAMDRTMPEGFSIEEARREAERVQRRATPSEPPQKTVEPPASVYVSPGATVPPTPYTPPRAKAPDTPPRAPMDATIQDLPTYPRGAAPPPNNPPNSTPGLEMTMQDVPLSSFPGQPPATPPPSKPYSFNFNSAPPAYPGAQSTTPHQLEERYQTNWMRRSDLRRRNASDGSGLTAMMAAPTPDQVKAGRSRSPLLIVLILLLLVVIAAAIGFFVLRALGVIAI